RLGGRQNSRMSSRDHDFSLGRFLHADLRRQHELLHGRPESGPRLLTGLLSPRFAPVLLYRLSHWAYVHHLSPIAKLISLINFTVFGIEIAVRCPIGPGLYFPHTQGTVIGALRIGRNATIYHGVTLGAKEMDLGYTPDARPIVLDDVV